MWVVRLHQWRTTSLKWICCSQEEPEGKRNKAKAVCALCAWVFTAVASLIPCSASLLSRVVLPPGLGAVPVRGEGWGVREKLIQRQSVKWQHHVLLTPAVNLIHWHLSATSIIITEGMNPNVDHHQFCCGNCLEMCRPCIVELTEWKDGMTGPIKHSEPLAVIPQCESQHHCVVSKTESVPIKSTL